MSKRSGALGSEKSSDRSVCQQPLSSHLTVKCLSRGKRGKHSRSEGRGVVSGKFVQPDPVKVEFAHELIQRSSVQRREFLDRSCRELFALYTEKIRAREYLRRDRGARGIDSPFRTRLGPTER